MLICRECYKPVAGTGFLLMLHRQLCELCGAWRICLSIPEVVTEPEPRTAWERLLTAEYGNQLSPED